MENKEQKTKNVLPIILFTIFLDMLGIGILIPVIPLLLADPASQYYLISTGSNPQSGFILLGYLTAIFPFMQFLATPILGELSDKYGRKPILWISIFGTFISYIVFAIAIILRNIPLLFISRGLDGITGGNISVAQAAIADITKPENRSRNFGLIGATFGLGFIVGPYLGGKLSDPNISSYFNAATPFWVAAALSFVNLILIYLIFKETNLFKNKEIKISLTKAFRNIKRAFSIGHMRSILLTNFFFQGGFTFFTTFFSVYLITKFGFTQGNVGDYFAYVGFWIVIAQAVVLRFFAKRFNESQILSFSLLGMAVFIFLMLFPDQSWQLLFISPFFAISNGLSQANITALVSKSADKTVQGEALGINSSVISLAMTVPPILAGYIAAGLTPESPIFVAAGTIAVAWLIFIVAFRKSPIKAPEWTLEKE